MSDENTTPPNFTQAENNLATEESTKKITSTNMDLLMDVSLRVTVELGRTRMTLRQVLELQNGAVVELERLAGDPVDIFVNERLIARGEVVVVDDKFGVRITELISPTDSGKG